MSPGAWRYGPARPSDPGRDFGGHLLAQGHGAPVQHEGAVAVGVESPPLAALGWRLSTLRRGSSLVEFEDEVVGIVQARDGTVLDVIRKVKEYEF